MACVPSRGFMLLPITTYFILNCIVSRVDGWQQRQRDRGFLQPSVPMSRTLVMIHSLALLSCSKILDEWNLPHVTLKDKEPKFGGVRFDIRSLIKHIGNNSVMKLPSEGANECIHLARVRQHITGVMCCGHPGSKRRCKWMHTSCESTLHGHIICITCYCHGKVGTFPPCAGI